MKVRQIETLSKLSYEEASIYYKGIGAELSKFNYITNLCGISFYSQYKKHLRTGIPVYLKIEPNEYDDFAIGVYLSRDHAAQVGWITKGGATRFPFAMTNKELLNHDEIYKKIANNESFFLAFGFRNGYYITNSWNNRNSLFFINKEEAYLE